MIPSTLKGLHPLPIPPILAAWLNRWPNYGIFSLGFSQIKEVRDCIAGQEAHHRKASFQEEFRALLRRYEIAFDEQNLWD
jgi:hypothetical protein